MSDNMTDEELAEMFGEQCENRKESGDEMAGEVLRDVADVITSNRGTHGDAFEQHLTAAKLWTTYLRSAGLLSSHERLSADQVCRMLTLLKISRDAIGEYNPDDDRDTAGYGAIALACAIREGKAPRGGLTVGDDDD